MSRSAKKTSRVRRRTSLARAVEQAAREKKRVIVPDRGVAIIPLSDLRRLRSLERRTAEDQFDMALMDQALAESREEMPYDQVRRSLGLG